MSRANKQVEIAGRPLLPSGLNESELDFRGGPGFWEEIDRITTDSALAEQLDVAMANHAAPRVWAIMDEPEGKLGVVAAALSMTRGLTSRGQAVVVIDADDNQPDLTRWSGRFELEGWIDLVRYGASILTTSLPLNFPGKKSVFMGVGSFCPTQVTADEVQEVLTRLRRQADDLILVLPANERALPWARNADIRILCWDRTARSDSDTEELIDRLEDRGAAPTALIGFGTAAEGGAVASGDLLDASVGALADETDEAPDEAEVESAQARWPEAGGELGTPTRPDLDEENAGEVGTTDTGAGDEVGTGDEVGAGAEVGAGDVATPSAMELGVESDDSPTRAPEGLPVAKLEERLDEALEEPADATTESSSVVAARIVATGDEVIAETSESDSAEIEPATETPVREAQDAEVTDTEAAGDETASKRRSATVQPRRTSGVFWALAGVMVVLIGGGIGYVMLVREPLDAEGNQVAGRSRNDSEITALMPEGAGEGETPTVADASPTGDDATSSDQIQSSDVGDAVRGTLMAREHVVGSSDPEAPAGQKPAEEATGGPETPPAATDEDPVILDRHHFGVPVGRDGWALWLFSLPDSSEAIAEVERLQGRGLNAAYRAVELAGRGRWYRVYVGSFPSRASAQESLPRVLDYLDHDWAQPARF